VTVFGEALESLLGSGAEVVAKLIARNLYANLGLNFKERKDWTLIDYLNYAKNVAKRG